MNRDTDVTYKTVNIFSSDKCFICFISDVPHYDACGTMICSYFGIKFLLFFMKIENVVLDTLPKLSNEHIKLTHCSKMNTIKTCQ